MRPTGIASLSRPPACSTGSRWPPRWRLWRRFAPAVERVDDANGKEGRPFATFALGFTVLAIPYLNLRKNVEQWLQAHTVPETMAGLPAWAWFDLGYLLVALTFLALVYRHRRRPLAIVPETSIGTRPVAVRRIALVDRRRQLRADRGRLHAGAAGHRGRARGGRAGMYGCRARLAAAGAVAFGWVGAGRTAEAGVDAGGRPGGVVDHDRDGLGRRARRSTATASRATRDARPVSDRTRPRGGRRRSG